MVKRLRYLVLLNDNTLYILLFTLYTNQEL
jgi:hypothetical protein